MDDAGIRCLSTHNGGESFTPDGIAHAIELNSILGSQFHRVCQRRESEDD